MGIDAMEEAFRHTDAITLMSVDELKPEDIIVNVSMVGAPSAKDTCCTVEHWKTVLKNFENASGTSIAGFTSCENGGVSTSNGWVISALTGVPVIDAPSNGRAHPSGPMGSIGPVSYTHLQKAIAEGRISPIRYENYKLLYNELKEKRRY